MTILIDFFPKQSENSIYRIVQESLNNIVKHSGASGFEIEIANRGTDCQLMVKDNGNGFRTEGNRGFGTQKSGFGLIGITERAKLLGGVARIESGSQQGTKVSVILPVKPVSTDL